MLATAKPLSNEASWLIPIVMAVANYQHVIAVSIGGFTSKQITDSSNIIKVNGTA